MILARTVDVPDGSLSSMPQSPPSDDLSAAARFRELADSLPQILLEADMAGRVTFLNSNALLMLGYGAEDLRAGLQVLDLIALHGRKALLRDMQLLLAGHRGSTLEYHALRKDGTAFP